MNINIPLAAELAQARTQMALTLGFHIVLASLGVAFPAMMLIANYIGLRRNDPDALRLAERWSKVTAATFDQRSASRSASGSSLRRPR